MAEGVALIRIDDEVDFRKRHGSKKPPTDYIRHAARLARKLQMDGAMGGTPQPDAEFFKALSKAFDEIAAGLELIAKPD